MRIRPIKFRDACSFVEAHHRHHRKPQGHQFSLSLIDDADKVVAVAIAGRPVSRMLDNGLTLEVTRLCSNGTPNACSKLYAAVRRVAAAMGYQKVITYTLDSEPGTSLFAAGLELDGTSGGGSWSRQDRKRIDAHPLEKKKRWVANISRPSA